VQSKIAVVKALAAEVKDSLTSGAKAHVELDCNYARLKVCSNLQSRSILLFERSEGASLAEVHSMFIRQGTPADIPQMRALAQQADTAAHWAEREYDALFAPDAPKRIALIAADSDETARGFVIARCEFDEWEIENVVVAADQRRRGIGSQLIAELIRLAGQRRSTSVLLEVRESNVAARALYQSFGFVQFARRPRYYQDPDEDALLLKILVSNPRQ
jgi:ribosomal-protein-alanine N-acetyltransferase